MTTTKHTAEPWRVEAGRLANEGRTFIKALDNGGWKPFVAETTRSVVDRGDKCEEGAAANARRIVACVNACAGIGTEALEKYGTGGIIEVVDDWRRHAEGRT